MRYVVHSLCLIVLILGVGLVSLMQITHNTPRNYNHLGKEKSPYLLQHKDNPVWWYAWGEEAFQASRKENKPIFLSIGYSTCHWCHVMEKESFEDREVAHLMNQHFISIKVDREERPDVDKIYMDAVVAMASQGGWPMSVFLTPDLKPFFGGTYFPKLHFIKLLNHVDVAWKKNQSEIQKSVQELTDYLIQLSHDEKKQEKIDDNIFSIFLSQLHSRFDPYHGGFGSAPKFPPSSSLSLLLRIAARSENKSALEMAHKTLEGMARGGIYDHLGGGFARYSTDSTWLVPHFEKMLYDNASLSWVYLEAYQLTQKKMYLSIAQETLNYILRDMTHPEGGFYSAEDADSEGHEGKFYVWTIEELKKTLSEKEFPLFQKVYGITQNGNFEHGTNILSLDKEFNWDVKYAELKDIHNKLFKIREKRIHPHKDDKILTAWNGLMIASLAKAYQVTQDKKYLHAAEKAAQFIQKYLYNNGKLLRRYRDGEAKFHAYLDDYAFFIHGLLNLYECSFDRKWLTYAFDLQKKQNEFFWDEKNGGYFFSNEDSADLIRRSKDYQDGAKPNSNAVSALNLLKLYNFTFNEEYKNRAKKIFENSSAKILQYPSAFSYMLIALDYYLGRSKEIAIIGRRDDETTRNMLSFLNASFLPNKILAFTEAQETDELPLTKNKKMLNQKTTAYVCENGVCQLPTSDLQVFKKQVQEVKKY